MALSALTLSTTTGVQNRPFQATINGLTTGRVEVLTDGSPGFSTVNGKLMSSGLPYPVSTVVLREYEPGVGQGFRDSRIDITASTREALVALAVASLSPGRTLVRTRIVGERQLDGSIVYSLRVDDDLGASVPVLISGNTPTPTPIYPQFAVGTKISFISDSIFAHGTLGTSPGTRLVRKLNTGPWEVAQVLHPRFSLEQWPSNTTARDNAAAGGTSTYSKQWTDGANRGVSGSPISFHTALLPGTLAMGAPLFAYSLTINSASLPNAEQVAIDQIFTPVLNSRGFVIAGTMPPWSPAIPADSGLDTPSNRAARLRINTAIRAWATSMGPSKVLLLDWDIALGAGSDGYAPAENFYDTLHPNSVGTDRMAAYLNSRLDLIIPAGNIFLARTAPNRQPNWNFTGTSGTAAGTVSGPIPTGYRLINASGTAATAVVTLKPNAETGGQTMVVTVQPVASSAAEEGFNLTYGTAGQIPVADLADKSASSYFKTLLPASPFAGLPTTTLYDPGSTEEARSMDVDTQYGNSSKRVGTSAAPFTATDPVKVGAGSSGPNVTHRLRFRGAEAFAAGAAPIVFEIEMGWTGEVGPAQPRWNSA